MSLSYVGFPRKEYHGDGKSMDALVEDAADSGIDFGINIQRSYFGIWPIEHPTEPDPHQDRPVNCPLPHSFINEDRANFGTRRKRHHSLRHDQEHIRVNPLLKGPLPPNGSKMFHVLQQQQVNKV